MPWAPRIKRWSMKKMRPIPFAEFRAFLQKLGYVEKRVPKGRVLEHPEEGLIVYRYYRDDEPVFLRDLRRTRTFLDLRTVIEADDFDATLLRANTPA
jgi:hypothetical protein